MKALYITQKVQIPIEDIRYMEASINYTLVCTSNQGNIISSTTIKRLNDKIDSNGFIRINKKYVLNKKIIKSYNSINCSVMIDDGRVFTLSRRKDKNLRAMLEQL